ncbi:MAG: hypothetical protein ACE5GB_06360 [Acidimicrobiales bacterium]
MALTLSSQDLAGAVFTQLDDYFAELDDKVLMSHSRCVDHLLDLYSSTDNEVVRRTIAEALDDIRRLQAVEADEMSGWYAVIGAVAAVEAAFDSIEL